jgi:hypothetical protein
MGSEVPHPLDTGDGMAMMRRTVPSHCDAPRLNSVADSRPAQGALYLTALGVDRRGWAQG